MVLICGSAIIWHFVRKKIDRNKDAEAATRARTHAEQGSAKDQYALAQMYYHGKGVMQDYAEALRWNRKAADQGEPRAQYAIGYMYHHGQGVTEDHVESILWCRKAADQGYAKAQYVMGNHFYDGQDAPQDFAEAARWFRQAADQNDAQAQVQFGYMEYNGQGVPQDLIQAAYWYRKAADQGNATAQLSLGYMYYKGQGVPLDRVEAARWCYKAARQGDQDARRALSSMRRRFTIFEKIHLSLAFLGSMLLLISSRGNIRNPNQRTAALAGFLGMSWVGLDLYRSYELGILRALSAVNAFYFAQRVLTGVCVAMFVFILWPRGAKALLRISATLFLLSVGLGIYAIAYLHLGRFALTVRLVYLANGLSIGMSIPSAIFLWLESKKMHSGHDDAVMVLEP